MNNLRVDVILETERRSASPVSVKFAGRIGAVALGIVVLTLVVSFVVRVGFARSERDRLRNAYAALANTIEKVDQYTNEVSCNRKIVTGLEGWNKARMLWHQHLADFQDMVPKDIQITSLRIGEQVRIEDVALEMDLRGMAVGKDPDRAVKTVDSLRGLLKSAPGFSNLVQTADIESCEEPQGAKTNRTFRMKVKYLPRGF